MVNQQQSGFGLKWAQDRVRAFHEKAGHPIGDVPKILESNRLASRISWMREEVSELEEARTLVDQVDAIIDLMYFALGTLVEIGVDGEPMFDIVHRANMSKVTDKGVLLREGDGKIQKPAKWVSPETEMIESLVMNNSRFDFFGAEEGQSLAACAHMIARAIGLPVARTERFEQFVKAQSESPIGSLGVRLYPGPFNAKFADAGLPLADDFVPIEVLDEANFRDALQESLATFPAVIVGLQIGQAYRREDSRVRYCLVVRQEINRVVVVDPGPDGQGIQSIQVDDLFAAIKSGLDGIHRISAVKD